MNNSNHLFQNTHPALEGMIPRSHAAVLMRQAEVKHDEEAVFEYLLGLNNGSAVRIGKRCFVRFADYERCARTYRQERLKHRPKPEDCSNASDALSQQIERLTAECDELRNRVRALEQIASFRRDVIDRLSQVSA